jgi:putative aldouronate transport system substrate-binding protein
MKNKKILFAITSALVFVFVSSCGLPTVPSSSVSNSSSSSSVVIDHGDGATLNMSVLYQADTKMKLDSKYSPYVAANGKTYETGMFKPVWEELQNRLDFTINDMTPNESSVSNAFKANQLNGFKDLNVVNGPAVDIVSEGVTKGTFIALNDYFDYLPNFKKFLDENEIVRINITAGDGNIYYAPYFDGYNDLERMFIARVDWVEKLLDGTSIAYDTDTLLGDTYYTPSMPATLNTNISVPNAEGTAVKQINKKYTKNVITAQNELEVKNGKNVCEALTAHIDSTYGNQYAKRSDLFVGIDAAYDADELVALFRCVKTNPKLLTGQDQKPLVPFYPRSSSHDRSADLLRLAMIWGVRGLESRSDYLYVDQNGVLQDARVQDKTYYGLEKLNQLYKEQLILQDFNSVSATSGGKGDYRGDLLNNNLGFMSYDYNQTTTVYNSLDSKYAGFNLAPVMPAVADWLDDGKYFHFTESIRSVKTEGWAITSTSTGKALNKALHLFDYLYSEEGNRLMSYGPEAWIDGTIMYKGKQVPKLSAAALNELANLDGAKGNYTNYYRRYLGGTFPVGYIKEQGMEYQTVHPKGQAGLDKLMAAMELGTYKTVLVSLSSTDNKFYAMVPTTYSLTKPEEMLKAEMLTTLNEKFKPTSSNGYIEFLKYVVNGFGSEGEVPTLSKEGLKTQIVDEWNQKVYIEIYREAYKRMTK